MFILGSGHVPSLGRSKTKSTKKSRSAKIWLTSAMITLIFILHEEPHCLPVNMYYNGKEGDLCLTADTRWLLQETGSGLPAILVRQVTSLAKVTLHDLGVERTVRSWQEKNDTNTNTIPSLYRKCSLNDTNEFWNCTSTGSSTLPTARNFQKYLTSTLSF